MKSILSFFVLLLSCSTGWLYTQLRQDTQSLLESEVQCNGKALSGFRSIEQSLLIDRQDSALETARHEMAMRELRLDEIVVIALEHSWKIADSTSIEALAERYRSRKTLEFLPITDSR